MNTFHLGIVGLGYAGKTVFLTSLLDHIFHHKPGKFRLGAKGDARIGQAGELPDSAKASDRFPYQAFRKTLAQGRRWPKKTCDTPRFSVRFKRSDWWLDTTVHLYDFPGERFADSLMADRDFAAWSDAFHQKMHGESEALDAFFALQDRTPAPDADELVRAYRLCLANMLGACRALITPSTFLLDRQGGQPSAQSSVVEWAKSRYAGMDEVRQFAPLVKSLRAKSPDIVKAFSAHYRDYRREIVDPLLTRLRQCDGCAVLVDIPGILTNGMGALNDAQAILRWLALAIRPANSRTLRWGRNLVNAIPFSKPWFNNLRRLAFVATKSDLIASGDDERMKGLLKDMAGEAAQWMHGLVDIGYFNCSSVLSTTNRDGKLFGEALFDAQGNPRAPRDPEVALSPTPMGGLDHWPPHAWDPGQYFFPDVYPRWPEHINTPPEHAGLDRIFDFLLGGPAPA